MPQRMTHDCCPNSIAFLRAYQARSERDRWNWHLLGLDRVAIYCPWCGVELEAWRKAQNKPRLVPVES